ncbi:hypothetical protein SAMN05421504_1011210 [Amycolatopsis xylanica]|uniref:Uncharacterized protein n=1 Tax=Amycolatopsis xylanica TaxID=589385 RepID=A0A1H2VFI7_9PSEU|nr:hypothetical protein [Amycolatopsis xylanica]SDW67103.1 hypothetical protein SAMN05421504_1011210 [Amycolatopsis xylanica]
MIKTRFAVGLAGAVALTLGAATAAQALEPPHGGTSKSYNLHPALPDGSAAAEVALAWNNGNHGRSYVSWETTRTQAGIELDVEIDGHVDHLLNGRVEKTGGTVIKTVRVRACDQSRHCGRWL